MHVTIIHYDIVDNIEHLVRVSCFTRMERLRVQSTEYTINSLQYTMILQQVIVGLSTVVGRTGQYDSTTTVVIVQSVRLLFRGSRY